MKDYTECPWLDVLNTSLGKDSCDCLINESNNCLKDKCPLVQLFHNWEVHEYALLAHKKLFEQQQKEIEKLKERKD